MPRMKSRGLLFWAGAATPVRAARRDDERTLESMYAKPTSLESVQRQQNGQRPPLR